MFLLLLFFIFASPFCYYFLPVVIKCSTTTSVLMFTTNVSSALRHWFIRFGATIVSNKICERLTCATNCDFIEIYSISKQHEQKKKVAMGRSRHCNNWNTTNTNLYTHFVYKRACHSNLAEIYSAYKHIHDTFLELRTYSEVRDIEIDWMSIPPNYPKYALKASQ